LAGYPTTTRGRFNLDWRSAVDVTRGPAGL
jgi:hypothetical protein